MPTDAEFSSDYAEARQRFVEICSGAGLETRSHRNPRTGPNGEPLYTDRVVIGPSGADRVLIVNSANHGVEGFSGSAALIGWLRSGFLARLPENTKVVLIHALNPHGFAWLRRVNEDNVDLNRNFVDHHSPKPENPEYEQIHDHILPENWSEDVESGIRKALEVTERQRGLLAMQSLICRGQYHRRDGVFYGGERPAWSHGVFLDIVRENAVDANRVVLLDFHTGLGAFGEPELICAAPPDAHVRNWFTDRVTSARLGNAVGPGLSGAIGQGLRRTLPEASVYSITVEFGTYDIYRVLMAILADNWLHTRGDPDSDAGAAIKKEMRRCFFPDTEEWREKVRSASLRILDQALAGISGE